MFLAVLAPMLKSDKNEDSLAVIASLERQVASLEKLTGHESEILSCKRAIERLKERLAEEQSPTNTE